MKWHVNLRIFRYKQDGTQPHFDNFQVEVKPDEYVLDAVERIWAEQDRTINFPTCLSSCRLWSLWYAGEWS